MRPDPDKIIKEVLRQGPKTPKELLHACRERGISKSTYHRHRKKLIKMGEVKEAKFELIEEAIEADHNEVQECVKVISKALRTGDENLLDSRIGHLKDLSNGKRVAHFPQVLQRIEECLESPMLVRNPEIFGKLADTLSNILFFERRHKTSDWDKFVERIQNKISPKAISIVKANPEFPDYSTITFLGKCGTKEAVETIFEKIKNNPSDAPKRTDTARALVELYPKHKRLINQYIDALIENKSLVEYAKELRQEISRRRPIGFSG